MASSLPQTFNPASVPAPRPSYSHICTTPLSPTTKLITVAGQIGIDPTTSTVPASFAAQVSAALTNLGACLAAAGATTRDVVKVTQYVVDYDPTERARASLYGEFMGDHRPPSTLVGVACLAEPELSYEIEAMAVVTTVHAGEAGHG